MRYCRVPGGRALPVLVAAVLILAGCATQQSPAGGRRPTPSATGGMAPIPNPPETASPPPAAPGPQAPSAAKRSAPKAVARSTERKSSDPAGAAKLRAAGLEQLNRGAIDGAVELLRQANQLDPANALIKRDLERAVRISQAVRARS